MFIVVQKPSLLPILCTPRHVVAVKKKNPGLGTYINISYIHLGNVPVLLNLFFNTEVQKIKCGMATFHYRRLKK